ncbi:hypothetical protein COCSUDRAFT_68254 [Coccomyxa subellipsoidea C-169]|uniref:Swiss Army Knife 2H phosphoesterase domain-containing protein n=1 Tax=Coccomyxa subellipsoidea (strain C-169) TaxID=574566 RepID=I0YJH0_COCSC|nr:hypothetical protein COCSUDRAFT_68254 [Coccomyxa subellipsoidea C-169]EIE18539.1 hypothetical protein COCSUDRAFT_68254 [Coccomyxa subellipsoidea C-169]|eukprot:XP_005643083.1 hypothetical protein COCSUDRAFT_68254 [Coccomyxa subellipsoidea C-169]
MGRSLMFATLVALLGLCAAQDPQENLSSINPLQVATGVVNGLLHKGQAPIPTPTPAPYDANKICDNISFPPTFPIGPAFTLSKTVFSAADIAFQPKPNYVQQTLNYTAVKPLYDAVAAYAATQGLTLANRGEAHITVLTPPEYLNVLQPFISIDQINAIAAPLKARFCVVCLGRDTLPVNGTLNTVFNVVVRSPDLAAVRTQIFEAYVKAGGDGSRFSPVNIFAPHITLGFRATNPSFVGGDLFVENGIFKWDNSCFSPITLV